MGIHKWLNEGQTPSCPLCRAEIDAGVGSVSTTPATLAFIENGNGDPASRLSQDIMGIFFHSLLMRAVASSQETTVSRLAVGDEQAPMSVVPGSPLTELQTAGG